MGIAWVGAPRWTAVVLGAICGLGAAHAADPPSVCGAAAQSWEAVQTTASRADVAAFYQQIPKVCDNLRGRVWSRAGELRGQAAPVAPQPMLDPCTAARVAWGAVRGGSVADLMAYREAVPIACEAQRFWADERIAALQAGAQPPDSRSPGAVFRDCPDCPEMVVLPAGSFVMGSPQTERGRRSNEGRQSPVQVASFAAGRFEVTFDQWDACVADGGCTARGVHDMRWGRADRPVINVSFSDAGQYVAWLSARTGQRYRLLSETEWEYAARGGTTTPFWWGETGGTGYAHCMGCASLWPNDRTAPVGSFPPNPFGLYDTAGNVWEWTSGCFADAPTASGPRAPDPQKVLLSPDPRRVVGRGPVWRPLGQPHAAARGAAGGFPGLAGSARSAVTDRQGPAHVAHRTRGAPHSGRTALGVWVQAAFPIQSTREHTQDRDLRIGHCERDRDASLVAHDPQATPEVLAAGSPFRRRLEPTHEDLDPFELRRGDPRCGGIGYVVVKREKIGLGFRREDDCSAIHRSSLRRRAWCARMRPNASSIGTPRAGQAFMAS